MYLLLPIKAYSEGPVEIRGRSALCTRKVRQSYSDSPKLRTRKVYGFYRFLEVFDGNLKRVRGQERTRKVRTAAADTDVCV